MTTEVAQPLSAVEVAHKFKVTPVTVHRWARTGRLTPLGKMPGLTGAYLFDPSVVAAFAAEYRK